MKEFCTKTDPRLLNTTAALVHFQSSSFSGNSDLLMSSYLFVKLKNTQIITNTSVSSNHFIIRHALDFTIPNYLSRTTAYCNITYNENIYAIMTKVVLFLPSDIYLIMKPY